MKTLSSLEGTNPRKSCRRVGRGTGSGHGKTSGRGQKGAGARSGYKNRAGKEGGQLPLFKKLPCRGFSRARFARPLESINLGQIDASFQDGDQVNEATLREHGFLSGQIHGIKILGNGELSKKVTIEANAFSKSACEQLDKKKITYKVITK